MKRVVPFVTLALSVSAAAAAHDMRPAWSPDGRSIAFQSDRDGNFEIYVADTDGRNVRRLTKNTVGDYHPAWSADSKRIVFQSHRDDDGYSTPGKMQLFVIDASGGNEKRLTRNQFNDFAPDWSPAADQIAFLSDRGGIADVFVMQLDGSEAINVTADLPKKGERGNPHWSPDGKAIAFDADFADGTHKIYAVDTSSKKLSVILEEQAACFFPAYSADGQRIAFSCRHDGNWEIFVKPIAGGAPAPVTSDPGRDFWHSWSPRGDRLVFTSNRGGSWRLHLMNADGSHLAPLFGDEGR